MREANRWRTNAEPVRRGLLQRPSIVLIALSVLALAIASMSIRAQEPPAGGPSGDEGVDLLLRSSVISVEFPLPDDPLPALQFLVRESLPDLGNPYGKFFSSDRVPQGSKKITNPTYGPGIHYMGPRISLVEGSKERTGISFYLDEFPLGFEFVNNTVGVPAVVEEAAAGGESGKLKYAYDKSEGVKTARKLIEQYTPGLGTVGGDFAIVERAEFQKEKGRLFLYRVAKTYRGIPLLDEYVQVALDGEKKPANVSYFWSNDIKPVEGEFKPIDANYALLQAKRVVLEEWNNQPPPLTLFNITLGYVNHRANSKALVPAWVLECRWNEKVSIVNPDAEGIQRRFGERIVTHSYVIAVDALIGQKVEMVAPGL